MILLLPSSINQSINRSSQLTLFSPTNQADVYSHGKSEEIIGKALQKYNIPRSRVVILTKCFFGVDEEGKNPPIAAVSTNDGSEWVNRIGLSRKHIFDAVDASVKRLGTYIDVLQIHRLDRETPREEIMRALNDVVESGKVRYIGASSVCWLLFWSTYFYFGFALFGVVGLGLIRLLYLF